MKRLVEGLVSGCFSQTTGGSEPLGRVLWTSDQPDASQWVPGLCGVEDRFGVPALRHDLGLQVSQQEEQQVAVE